MIITILCWILVIIAVGLVLLAIYNDWDALWFIAIVIGVVCIIVASIGTVGGIDHSINYDIEHQKAIEERNTIVYRIEKQSDSENDSNYFIVNGGLYNDIVEFNAKVRNDKKWGNNHWTDWFNGWVYADLEEIDINKYTNSNKPTEENNDNKTVCFYCDLLKTTNAQVSVGYCPYCGAKIGKE